MTEMYDEAMQREDYVVSFKEEILPGIFKTTFHHPALSDGNLQLYMIVHENGILFVDTGGVEVSNPLIGRYDVDVPLYESHVRVTQPRTLEALLEGTGFGWEDVTAFVTHMHPDHAAYAPWFAERGARVLRHGGSVPYDPDVNETFMTLSGAREKDFPFEYGIWALKFEEAPVLNYPEELVETGTVLDCGRYQFEVISTPGHEFDDACLIDRNQGILFSADVLLGNKAPIVCMREPDLHGMTSYIRSLSHLEALEAEILLPAHAEPFFGKGNVKAVIAQNRDYQLEQVDKVFGILLKQNQPMTAVEIEEFYRPSKCPAEDYAFRGVYAMKVLSYCEFLYDQGLVERSVSNGGALRYQAIAQEVI